MRKSILWLYCILFCFNISIIHAQTIPIEEAFAETFENPVGIEYSHEDSNLLYIVRKTGFVDVKNLVDPDAPSTNFIDISDRVIGHYGELGLLGMAFSPDYPEDETFYLYYTFRESGGERDIYSTLARFKAPDGVADPDSEERLFEILQPQDNHNGGQIIFGPDGYLYVALGDGGRDSKELAQDTQVLNGSILRIDVNQDAGYSIPSDNPFVGDSEGMDEIYAWGFRNPWRISFDPETGYLWAADVGEKDWESIYIVEKGINYGWPVVEGSHCFPMETECDKSDLGMPLFEYPWGESEWGRSITGGYVYRGSENPSLYGKYIYGDFISRQIWALEIDHDNKTVISNSTVAEARQMLPTFGVDSAGELYIGGWGDEPQVFRFEPEIVLTSLALEIPESRNESIQLNWQVSRTTGLAHFNVYRGSDVDELELHTTVPANQNEYIDSDLHDGSVFYSVAAVDEDGEEWQRSNLVSYYNETIQVSDQWSLISLPFESEGITISNSTFYSFSNSYQLEQIVVPGIGYWARGGDNTVTYRAKGVGLQRSELQLNQGWNLVGGLIGELPAEFIEDPGEILSTTPVFEFDGSVYNEVGVLAPGRGYWIYADEEGEIFLDLENRTDVDSVEKRSVTDDAAVESFNRLHFSMRGHSSVIYLTQNALTPYLKDRYRLPPVAPRPLLDVRTSEGFRVGDRERSNIEIFAEEYPVDLRFEASEDEKSHNRLRLILIRDGNVEDVELKDGEQYRLTGPYDSIEAEILEVNERVERMELLPAYPNPFNPVTNITYRVSDQADVEVSVYDAAGRRMAQLVNKEQQEGQYRISFDASGLASGIYFVRFHAGSYIETRKMTLIK